MAGKWINCALADACASIDYGLTASAVERDSGPKFLRITDIVSENINWETVPRVVADDTTIDKYRLHEGDIVLARTGASTGASAYVKNPPLAVFASYLVRLKAKPEFDPRYLAYYLRSELFWTYIRGVLGDKSAQPNASASTMTKAPLFAPEDKKEQRAIARILGSLDDKIELNHRMNETLAAIAHSIFKSWFVDFDPVQAKEEGRAPAGMDAETAALFPDNFEETELGIVPRGWRIGSFDETIELIGGGTPKTSVADYWNGNIPWFSVVDAPINSDVFVIETEKKITERGITESSTRLLPIGTTIITARGTVGKCALVGIPMAMNQSCYGIRGRDGRGNYFIYFALRNLVSELQQSTHGSVFDTITRDTFGSVRSIIVPDELTQAFDRKVLPLMEKIIANLREKNNLAAIRDTLLPKLLSGEIRVRELNNFLEANS